MFQTVKGFKIRGALFCITVLSPKCNVITLVPIAQVAQLAILL